MYAKLVELRLRRTCAGPRRSESADARVDLQRMMFSLDGDQEQLFLITELLAPLTKQQRIEVLKYAGGSSSFQQPNDLMKGFMIFRRFLKSPLYKAWNPSADPPSAQLAKLERKLREDGMDKASMEGFLKVFRATEFVVPRAWSVS